MQLSILSLLTSLLAITAALPVASPLEPAGVALARDSEPSIARAVTAADGTDGRGGYNKRDKAGTDGRGGYNKRDKAGTDGRGGYNKRDKAGTDGRGGYNKD